MEKVIKKWKEWKQGKDEDWIYDESHNFIDNLSRSEIVDLLEFAENKHGTN